MSERQRLFVLIFIMTMVATIIGAGAVFIIYQGGLERERGRLLDLVQSQARLLAAMAEFDKQFSTYPDGAEAGSLRQFAAVHNNFTPRGLGETGEFTLARREGDSVVFVLRQSRNGVGAPLSVPIGSGDAEAMVAALGGGTGTMICRDYAGKRVLAAFAPVAVLNMGLVAKIEIAEIRRRFTKTAAPLMLIGVITVAAATLLVLKVTRPVGQQLIDSEAQFRGTFENAAVGMAHVGVNGAWLRVNERLCEIIGYSRDELRGKTIQDISHPEDLKEDLDQFAQLLRGEISSYSLEKRYFHRDGHVVWVNLTTAVQRDDEGRPRFCISVVEDIGRRKRAEQTLRESENRMRALLDASEDDVLLVSTSGRILAINKAAERRLAGRLAGIDPVGAELADLLPADLAEARLANVRIVADSGRLAHLDLPIRDRWFDLWFYPVRHDDRPITEVAIFAREITDQKRAESELRRLYQAIQQSPSSVVITDTTGAIVYVNPKFTQVTGYDFEEVVGQNPRVLKSGHTTEEEYALLWQTIMSGRIWQGEFRNRRKDGQLYWEIASIAPVKNDNGEIINFVAVKEDVTERRAVEEQLRQSQKLQAIGQLTGGIAHDFNNLLTIIVGNLQLLERAPAVSEPTRRFIADALWAAERGGELTHRLLAFARMQPLSPALVNLNDVVRSLASLLQRTLGPGIDVAEALEASLPFVLADVGELERAVVNLAINARDAMPDGGRLTLQTGRATLDADYVERYPDVAPGAYVMLAVSDTGTGIAADVLGRIFEPFFTTKQTGEGSGLGLSMVYGFVKQSGGHISVYSEPGRGTTFKLFFPQLAVTEGAAGRASGEGETDFVAGGRTALVVEDEERLRTVAARLLREVGFIVREARDSGEALYHAESAERIELLFTDVELPGGGNGVTIAEAVRQRHPGVRVLYTTGYSPLLAVQTGRLPPNSPVLAKPFARQQLIASVRTLFAGAAPGGCSPAPPADRE